VLILAVACLYKKPPQVFVEESGSLPKDPGVVGLVEPVFLDAEAEDAFAEGVYVGNILMSGGFVVDEDAAAGMQTQSKEYAFNSEQAYREVVEGFVSDALGTRLTDEGIAWRSVELAAPLPERRAFRGSHDEDGQDNVNLPRFTLAPASLSPASVEGVEVLLVPYVVRYYSHNGGWFVGQHLGCEAGARMRLFWVAYDNASGAPLAWRDVDVRYFEEHLFTPSSAQLEDALIEVEALVAKDLDKHLW